MKEQSTMAKKIVTLLHGMGKPTQTQDRSTHANGQIHARSQEPSDAFEWNQLGFQPKEEVQQHLYGEYKWK